MAERVELFEVTTPEGTASTSPQTTVLPMNQGQVDEIEVTIPGGHAGLTGIAFFHSSQQVIPYKSGTFVRGDGQTLRWPLARYPTGSKWTVRTFNTDVYPHTHHLRVLITDIPARIETPAVSEVPVQPEASTEQLAEAEQLPEFTPEDLALIEQEAPA